VDKNVNMLLQIKVLSTKVRQQYISYRNIFKRDYKVTWVSDNRKKKVHRSVKALKINTAHVYKYQPMLLVLESQFHQVQELYKTLNYITSWVVDLKMYVRENYQLMQ